LPGKSKKFHNISYANRFLQPLADRVGQRIAIDATVTAKAMVPAAANSATAATMKKPAPVFDTRV
jgi:hypothetical protein